jgi:hypothetical protein
MGGIGRCRRGKGFQPEMESGLIFVTERGASCEGGPGRLMEPDLEPVPSGPDGCVVGQESLSPVHRVSASVHGISKTRRGAKG